MYVYHTEPTIEVNVIVKKVSLFESFVSKICVRVAKS
jgi:hypothetical protein